MHSPVEVN